MYYIYYEPGVKMGVTTNPEKIKGKIELLDQCHNAQEAERRAKELYDERKYK